MIHKRYLGFLVLMLLVLVPVVMADSQVKGGPGANSGVPCTKDGDCVQTCSTLSIAGTCYCEQTSKTCFLKEAPASSPSINTSTSLNQTAVKLASEKAEKALQQAQQSAAAIEEVQQGVSTVQEGVSALETKSQDLDTRVKTLEDSSTNVQQQITLLKASVDSMSGQQAQVQQDVAGVSSKLSTGLATLQSSVDTKTKELNTKIKSVDTKLEDEKSSRETLSYVFFILLALAAILGVGYYVTQVRGVGKSKNVSMVNDEMVSYIGKHIKEGKKYVNIKDNLLKVGWAAEEIEGAFKEALRQNYPQALKGNGAGVGKESATQQRKMMGIIGMVLVVVAIGAFFLIKGSTGHAIYIQSEAELQKAVKDGLDTNLAKSTLYLLVDFANICVQVDEGKNSVSYQVIKTSAGHITLDAPQPCDWSAKYDFAVKFTSLEAYSLLMDNVNCALATKVHLVKGVYVLPSKYVLSGFKPNDTENLGKFCPVLASCLSKDQFAKLGFTCEEVPAQDYKVGKVESTAGEVAK